MFDLSFVARSLVGEYDEFDLVAAFVVVLRMQQLKMLVPTYWLVFTNEQVPKIPHALLWIPKNKGKSLHDRMDVPTRIIDFLLVEESSCQS